MSDSHVYLPVRDETGEGRVGFMRKAHADMTAADREYIESFNQLRGSTAFTDWRHSPELKQLIHTYLLKRDQEHGQPA